MRSGDIDNNLHVSHFSPPTVNNLGGLGPEAGEPMLYFTNFTMFEGHAVDLLITNITEYIPKKTEENGLHGDFLMINVMSGTNVTLLFQLFELGTRNPYHAPGLILDCLDLDTAADGMSVESVTVDGLTAYSVSKESEISVTRAGHGMFPGALSFTATTAGNKDDNPEDADDLTDEQLARTVSFHFDSGSSTFYMNLMVAPKGHGGRKFIFAGTSPLSEVGVTVPVEDVMQDALGLTTQYTTTTTTTHNVTSAIEAAEAVVQAAEADPESADAVAVSSAAAAVVAASSNSSAVAEVAAEAASLDNSSSVSAAVAAANAAIREAANLTSTAAAVATTTTFVTVQVTTTTTTMLFTTTTTPSPQVAAGAAAASDAEPVAVAAAAEAAAEADPADPAAAVQAAVAAAAAQNKTARVPGKDEFGEKYVTVAQVGATNLTLGCPECTMTQTFQCAGFVRYGYEPRWTRWWQVGDMHGDLYCSTEWFQSFGVLDPWPLHGKICQCMQRTGGVCGASALFKGLWWPILLISFVYLLYWLAQLLGRDKNDDLFIRTLHRAESASFVAPMICSILVVSYKIPDPFVADIGDMSSISKRESSMIAIVFTLQVLFNIYKEWDHVQQMQADILFDNIGPDDDGKISREKFMGYHWRKMHGAPIEANIREHKEEEFIFLPNAWAVVRGLVVILMYAALMMLMLRMWYQSNEESSSYFIASLTDPDYTGFHVAWRISVVYFTIYAALELVTLGCLVHSQAVLKLAALSFSHAPALVVLIVTIQSASLAGGAIMPDWVHQAMILAECGLAGQVIGSLLLPVFFEYSLSMTRKGNVDLVMYGRRSMQVVNGIRWFCIAIVYMAVYYLLKALTELPSPPDCSIGRADVQWIIFWLTLVYYVGYVLSWFLRAFGMIRDSDSPLFGQGGHLSVQQALFAVVAIFLITDIVASNGADWTAAIVVAVCCLCAIKFTLAENIEIRDSPDGAMKMSSLNHMYMCGREWLEWIPTASCLMLAYFLINSS